MSNLYSAYKRFDDAKNSYVKTIELNSRNINARNKPADLYEKLGDKDKATKEWLEIRGIDYNDIHAESHDVHKRS